MNTTVTIDLTKAVGHLSFYDEPTEDDIPFVLEKLRSADSLALKNIADQIEAAFKPPREPGWYQVEHAGTDGRVRAYYWNGEKFQFGPDSLISFSESERFENITPLAVVP